MKWIRWPSYAHSACRRIEKTRVLNPYTLPKKMQKKWQVPKDEKNLQIESKLIQVIQ